MLVDRLRRFVGLPPRFPTFEGWTMRVIPNRRLRLGEHVLHPGRIYTVPGANASYWAREGLARLDGGAVMPVMEFGTHLHRPGPDPRPPTW